MDALDRVFHYHEATKHHFHRFARALGYMDWASQPDPFRRYEGAPVLSLPLLKPEEPPRSPSYEALYRPGAVPPEPLSIRSLSRFFEYALAVSAWKQAGDVKWALRTNPSSGNLHPTEGYLMVGPQLGEALPPGVYHYAPKEHGLERRASSDPASVATLLAPFPRGAFLVGWTSVHWREAWKYGERAFRYCQHDIGHAIGTARIAAAALGWRLLLLDGTSDDLAAALLGVDRTEDYGQAEREHPDGLAVVWPGEAAGRGARGAGGGESRTMPLFLEPEAVRAVVAGARWHGKANRLSPTHPVDWEIIDEVAAASWKSTDDRRSIDWPSAFSDSSDSSAQHATLSTRDSQDPTAGRLIRRRRSAVALDGRTSIPAARFFAMLDRVMPRPERPPSLRPMPWDAVPWEPTIHLLLFVHRVEGLAPGLYLLSRDSARTEALKKAAHPRFAWTSPPGCPPDLPLFLLEEGDAQRLAAQVSCGQDIAGAGAFSLGMVAEFEATIRRRGPWFYRRLFWESGLLGQVLYLEAEAAGVRGTGIGCFFDDPVHQVLGLADRAFQSLYHFTVGGPVEDHRLTTLPAYEAREG